MTDTSDAPMLLEVAKVAMLTITTLGVTWMCRTLFLLRDAWRDLNAEVRGPDGKNGIKSKVVALLDRVDAIEERNQRIDAVVEWEKEQHPGPDRRMGARRLRDVMREAGDERLHE